MTGRGADQNRKVASLPGRRRSQFSLGGLLIVITLLSVWLALRANQARVQRRSADELQANFLGYDYQWLEGSGGVDQSATPAIPAWILDRVGQDFFYKVVFVNLNGASARAERLNSLGELRHLRYLGLDNAELTDSVAASIGRMRNLELLSLQMTGAKDEHLRELTHLKQLRRLWLSFDGVTDEGLKYLADLTSLELLQLQGNRVTDKGLPYLKKLDHLEILVLTGNQGITDEGLKHLRGLTALRKVRLRETAATADGINDLQTALPLAQIGP